MLTNEEFVEHVREYQSGLRAYVRSLGVDALWVDDVAQEALVIAYERRDRFDVNLSFRNWVWGIARNCVLNDRRKSARRNRILNDNLTDILVSTSSASDEVEEHNDLDQYRLAALKECLSQIPEKSREMLRQRYELNLKATDLAEALDMKSAAVRKSLERIRSSMRKCMETRIAQIAGLSALPSAS
ncbi:MAG: RNA polymerase sigma-70 factor (ECF subfamily) [Verrucomicrobiales bacterium]|jgi:RNA polymerase sigma-70 factor (ECF subfamily)